MIYRLIFCFFLAALAVSGAPSEKGSTCYDIHGVSLGCFNDNPPFDDLPLPWGPEKIQPRFFLYTRTNKDKNQGIKLDLNLEVPSQFGVNKETKLIIHGFLSDFDSVWMHEMKDELLANADMNVIIVDWEEGANVWLWQYENAASNTRVVASYLAQLLLMISSQKGYPTENFHCIGHSLGAQTCGFTGKNLRGALARISGLDPAGPNFENKEASAHLYKGDAQFVDIIHTHGKEGFIMDFGIGEQIGDVDFVPNGGGVQPGCVNYYKHEKIVLPPAGKNQIPETVQADVYGDAVSCSHGRSIEYFIESINGKCEFLAVPCPHMEAQENGDCRECVGHQCQILGYYTDTRPGRGVHYLETNRNSPFCQGQP